MAMNFTDALQLMKRRERLGGSGYVPQQTAAGMSDAYARSAADRLYRSEALKQGEKLHARGLDAAAQGRRETLAQQQGQFEAGLGQRQREFAANLAFEKLRHGNTMGLERARLGQQQKQFEAGLSQRDKEFIAQHGLERYKIETQKDQFAEKLGLDREMFDEATKQFGVQQAFAERQWGDQYGLEQQKLEESKYQFDTQQEFEQQKFGESQKQFQDTLAQHQAEVSLEDEWAWRQWEREGEQLDKQYTTPDWVINKPAWLDDVLHRPGYFTDPYGMDSPGGP